MSESNNARKIISDLVEANKIWFKIFAIWGDGTAKEIVADKNYRDEFRAVAKAHVAVEDFLKSPPISFSPMTSISEREEYLEKNLAFIQLLSDERAKTAEAIRRATILERAFADTCSVLGVKGMEDAYNVAKQVVAERDSARAAAKAANGACDVERADHAQTRAKLHAAEQRQEGGWKVACEVRDARDAERKQALSDRNSLRERLTATSEEYLSRAERLQEELDSAC